MSKKFIAVALMSLALTGCATVEADPIPSATTPAAKVIAPKTPAEAEVAFKQIANDSCDKANAVGVTEESNFGTMVMVPKDHGYKDYSAAYLDKSGEYGLIWETDAFTACGWAIQFSLAEEGGGAIDATFEFSTEDGSYTSTQTGDIYEGGKRVVKHIIQDGLIASTDDSVITYGDISADELEILTTAVDNYLSENG